MNRTFIILFMAAVAALAVTAQTAMPPQSQAKELAERINTVASSISTMQCGFEQVKSFRYL